MEISEKELTQELQSAKEQITKQKEFCSMLEQRKNWLYNILRDGYVISPEQYQEMTGKELGKESASVNLKFAPNVPEEGGLQEEMINLSFEKYFSPDIDMSIPSPLDSKAAFPSLAPERGIVTTKTTTQKNLVNEAKVIAATSYQINQRTIAIRNQFKNLRRLEAMRKLNRQRRMMELDYNFDMVWSASKDDKQVSYVERVGAALVLSSLMNDAGKDKAAIQEELDELGNDLGEKIDFAKSADYYFELARKKDKTAGLNSKVNEKATSKNGRISDISKAIAEVKSSLNKSTKPAQRAKTESKTPVVEMTISPM